MKSNYEMIIDDANAEAVSRKIRLQQHQVNELVALVLEIGEALYFASPTLGTDDQYLAALARYKEYKESMNGQ